MSIIHPGLFLIMSRFPSDKDALRRMYRNSQSFQNLCDDYRKCLKAISYWTASVDDLAAERSREYVELCQDLEWEIRELIERKGKAS